ncbi:PAS domain-containing protein [Humitalea sp. 24SJ18S-53]|uniref:PAS domain-containing protein n=1 Tax=Humitalea sp. 24SJ18S-53 TaxID=3422307 RepID=UPI003D66A734
MTSGAGNRPGRPGWPFRRIVACLVFVAVLPLWALAAVTAWIAAERDIAALVDAAGDAARRGALAVDGALMDQRAALLSLAGRESRPAALVAFGPAAMPQPAPNVGARLVVADATGRILAASAPPRGADAPAANSVPANAQAPDATAPDTTAPDTAAHDDLASLPPTAQAALIAAALSGTTQVSGVFRRASGGSAETLVAVPTSAPGRLALGAIADGIGFWSTVLRAARPPEGWSASIVDREGVVLARIPDPSGSFGERVRAGMQDSLFGPTSGSRGKAALLNQRGEPVHAAWQRLESAPWVVVVALPVALVDDAFRAALLPVGFGGAVLVLLAVIGGSQVADMLIGRPLRRLSQDAAGLGQATGGAVATGRARGPRVAELAAAQAAMRAAADRFMVREEEVRSLATRLGVVLESTTDSVLGIDADFRIGWLNGRAAAMLGEADRSILGQNLFDKFPGCDTGIFGLTYRAAQELQAPQHVTAWHDALGLWLSADAYPSGDGGLTIFCRDAGAQRAIEQALRESEARLRAVLDHIPLGVMLAEAPSGRIVFGNKRLEEVLGQSVESLGELTPDTVWDTFQPDGRRLAPTETPLGQTLASGAAASREMLYRRRDGTTTWLRASAAPIRDAQGRMSGAVMAVTDVAIERRAAEALRESELRFRTLAEAVPQIVWSARPDGSVDYVNPRFTEFTGRPAHEASLPGSPVLHPEDQPAVRTAWISALAAGRSFAAEYRLRGSDGSWRWFSARALPARGPEGAVRRWIGAATDVTDLIAAREALQIQVLAEANARAEAVAHANAFAVSEERFRRFGSASPDVLWITEAAGARVEYVSPAFERIWGAACADLVADPGLWTRLIHSEDRDRVIEAHGAEVAAGSSELEYRVLRVDGQERWIRDRTFPIADAFGTPYARGGIARDVTEAKAAEARQRLLIGELNHRVKNTLATVHSLSLQTARGHLMADNIADPPLGAAAGASTPMVRFVIDLQARILALSRAHDLLTATTWQGATLRETVRSALGPWLPGRANETPRVAFAGPGAWLAPKQALGLALGLHELATNAAKHGGLSVAEGRVSVQWTRTEGGAIRLRWRETGGPAVQPPTRRGFGTRLLERGLAGELGEGASVKLDYAPAGVVATIIFHPPSDAAPADGLSRDGPLSEAGDLAEALHVADDDESAGESGPDDGQPGHRPADDRQVPPPSFSPEKGLTP